MWNDQFIAAPPPAPNIAEPPAQPTKSIHGQLDSLLRLVEGMTKRVMPDGKTLASDIPVREGKETVTALTSMFSTIMRHHTELHKQEQGEIFRSAVINVARQMDERHSTEFLSLLEAELERLQSRSKLARPQG